MNVDIEKLPECRAKLSAEIPAETVSQTRDVVVNAFKNQANIRGFRPGKVPQKVIEQKFASRIEEELKERLSRSILAEAYNEKELPILGIQNVEREVFESDGTFSFVSEVVIRPDVELTQDDYMNIEIDVPEFEVTDEMIDGFLSRVQKNFAEYEESDEAIEHGDKVSITYTSTSDGKPLIDEVDENIAGFVERDEEVDYHVPEKDSEGGEMIPGLGESLVGAKAGDSIDVEVEFKDDHFIEELHGVEAVFSVKIIKVEKPNLPPIDDEMAKKMGAENLEAVRENYKREMGAQQQRQRETFIENKILEHINKDHEFELPRDQVFNETQEEVNRMFTYAVQQGYDPESLGEQEDEIVESAGQRAISNLRTRYLLEEIAKLEKIEVSDDELSRLIVFQAQQAKRPVKKYVQELRDGPGLEAIRGDILISKTIDFLKENANLKDEGVVEEADESEGDDDEETNE